MVGSWVDMIRCSSHFLIYLELDRSLGNLGIPFKYNSDWENLEEFRDLVKANWKPFTSESNENPSSEFVSSLETIKWVMSSWAEERRKGLDVDINQIEVEWEDWNKKLLVGLCSQMFMDYGKQLEMKRQSILVEQKKSLEA